MILKNTKAAQEFLPSLNLSLDNERLSDFFRRAQEWLVRHIIGSGLESVLEAEVGANATDSHADLRKLCQRVIAVKALADAIPEMDMQLTEAGFAVQDNDNYTPASAQRVERLRAQLPGRISNDTDALVNYLISGSGSGSSYAQWRNSDQFKYLTSAFMPTEEDFSKVLMAVSPGESVTYEQFYALIPGMAMEMREVADYFVGEEEINRLVNLYRQDGLNEVQRKAVARLRDVAVAACFNNAKMARNAAIRARQVMVASPSSFTEFQHSNASQRQEIDLDGGKTVNFL